MSMEWDETVSYIYLIERLHARLQLLLHLWQGRHLGQLLSGQLELLLDGGYLLFLKLEERKTYRYLNVKLMSQVCHGPP